ncbi:uncharacterized protein [Penaeus vannamei]|uniref:uncharacterized protein n=1 Tax=Penaeus vannamei TaxID=6689 RepID=UPI00387F9A03
MHKRDSLKDVEPWNKSVTPSIASVLKSLYEHAKSTVLIGDKYSTWFKSNAGVRQGCVSSPTLFNIFLEQILMDTLDSFDTFNTRKYGMEVSAEKSKILIVGKERKTLAQPIQINGDELEMVDSLLRTTTLAIALYGCETWTLDAVSQNKINAFEMKYRKFLRILFTAHRTNDSVREELRQKVGNIEMISAIRKRQLKWFGHVTRHSDKLPLASNIMHALRLDSQQALQFPRHKHVAYLAARRYAYIPSRPRRQ